MGFFILLLLFVGGLRVVCREFLRMRRGERVIVEVYQGTKMMLESPDRRRGAVCDREPGVPTPRLSVCARVMMIFYSLGTLRNTETPKISRPRAAASALALASAHHWAVAGGTGGRSRSGHRVPLPVPVPGPGPARGLAARSLHHGSDSLVVSTLDKWVFASSWAGGGGWEGVWGSDL